MTFFKNIFLITLFAFYGCDQFTLVKKEKKEDVIEEEWNKIDKKSIEEPPLFAVCTMVKAHKQDSCFASQIYNHIQSHLKNESLLSRRFDKIDTLYINLRIDKEAVVSYEDFTLPEYVKQLYPDFKIRLNEGISSLPELLPATKRGVPTNIKYRLPILIPSE